MHPPPKKEILRHPPTYITGMGTINCTGVSPQDLWKRVLEGRSFIQNGLGLIPDEFLESIKSELSHSPFKSCLEKLYTDLIAHKFYLCSLFSIQQAFQQSGWDRLGPEDCLLLATTTGQSKLWESPLADYSLGKGDTESLLRTFQEEPLGKTLHQLMVFMGANCQGYLISSACNASTQAIYLADLFLRENKFKRCLVGGTELLSELVVQGFKSLQILSDKPASPFCFHREGINLSEGSAFLCLEREPKSTPLASLAGGSFFTESFHMTSPDPGGRGYFQAMNLALEDSLLSADEISWIHAHGTGSPKNDLSEASAIESLFSKVSPWVCSTKTVHGHMLGASGALESIICALSLSENMIPPNGGLAIVDPNIRVQISKTKISNQNRFVLKNTAGFGGNNSSLVFGGI